MEIELAACHRLMRGAKRMDRRTAECDANLSGGFIRQADAVAGNAPDPTTAALNANYTTYYFYDGLNRPVCTIDPLGQDWTISTIPNSAPAYSAGDHSVRTTYDALGDVSTIKDQMGRTVYFRQACVNHFQACGIVGCQSTTFWRTADGGRQGTEPLSGAGGRSTAIRALAPDAAAPLTHPRLIVGGGGKGGQHVWRSPDVQGMRVDYYALKKRAERSTSASHPAEEAATVPFLELAPSAFAGPCECTLELEIAAGAKMRIHLRTVAAPDLAAICRSLWNPAL